MENRRGTTKSKGKKEINDKFYTKPEIAKELIKEVNLEEYDSITIITAFCGRSQ